MINVSAHGSSGIPLQITEGERVGQLEQTIRDVLGHPLEPDKFAALAKIQAELWRVDHILDQSLEDKKIGRDEYLSRMHDAMAHAMVESSRLLGRALFHRIFGDAGDHPEGSIDPEGFPIL